MKRLGVLTKFGDHPPGLFFLFFAEMWERFSYYGLRALLILYMTSELLFTDTRAYGIYATYTALVYTTPIIGGFIADRFIGNRRAIIIGGILIALGHLTLALPGNFGFYPGLAFIVSGTGLFKANIAALLGQLYHHGDPRRDPGFTIFYVGINVGGFLAPLLCGFVGARYGWDYGFSLAAIGMLAGLVTFLVGLSKLDDKGKMPETSLARKNAVPGIKWEQIIYLGCFISVPLFSFMIQGYEIFKYILPVVLIMSVLYMIYLSVISTKEERYNILTLLALMPFFVMFFALFEQIGSSMNLFAERVVNRDFFGWEIPTPWFQSLNPLFIITLGPVFAALWPRLAKRNLEPYTPFKFFLGLFQASLGYGAMALGASMIDTTGSVPVIFLILTYFLFTTGELCIAPVGLSMVTKLSPEKLVSTLMGIWFLSIAAANYIAGELAKLTAIDTGASLIEMVNIYGEGFTTVMYIGLASALIMLIASPFLKSVFAHEEHMDD